MLRRRMVLYSLVRKAGEGSGGRIKKITEAPRC